MLGGGAQPASSIHSDDLLPRPDASTTRSAVMVPPPRSLTPTRVCAGQGDRGCERWRGSWEADTITSRKMLLFAALSVHVRGFSVLRENDATSLHARASSGTCWDGGSGKSKATIAKICPATHNRPATQSSTFLRAPSALQILLATHSCFSPQAVIKQESPHP